MFFEFFLKFFLCVCSIDPLPMNLLHSTVQLDMNLDFMCCCLRVVLQVNFFFRNVSIEMALLARCLSPLFNNMMERNSVGNQVQKTLKEE